ncbi:phosphohydrolase [Deinococcus sp.]|uniref:HD domain-containing protein n=1 Tax=Deinococcus sp. TaxID=47478 RepID=UPI003C7D0E2C
MEELTQAGAEAVRRFCEPFYREPHRAYHTLRHVEATLEALRIRGALSPALAMAVWGHDLINDPHRHDNEEQSAEQFGDWLESQGAGAVLVAEVRRLMLETRHTDPPTDRTAALLVDADLSVFGADDETFWTYEQAIRQEYSFVPWPQYREGRMALLDGFLERERIYTTPEFAGLEAGARVHLRAALEQLETRYAE